MSAVTRTLARHVSTTGYGDLPPAIRHEGVRAFVNWLGCAVGGAREAGVEQMVGFLAGFDSGAHCTILGRKEKLDLLNAAFVNSMSSAALAFNDTHFATVAHPTSPVAAALFALAERRAIDGRRFIAALVHGIEVQCRVGNALVTPPAQCAVGLSMQGLVGVIGAAVAVGHVLGLDEHRMAVAIGLAANQSCGLREAHGTMGSNYTPGNAARAGIVAAMLAERGFSCSDTAIEGVKGFAVSFGSQPQPQAALAGLGEQFEISKLAYKPYPSGFVVHPIADACLAIARREQYDPNDIERVELEVNPLALQLCNRPEPKTRGQAVVSFPHSVATALIHKACGLGQLTDAMIHDPAIDALRHRIVATPRADLGREAAVARVVLKGGRTLSETVTHCRGSEGRPLTDEDIGVKTLDQLGTVYAAEAAKRIVAAGWKVADEASVGTLAKLF